MPMQVNGASTKVSINFIDGFGNKYDELTKTLTRGYPLSLPAAQTHDGYTFIGWNNGEHTFNANASYQAFITETFSATWQINPTTPTPIADTMTTASTPITSSTQTQNETQTPSQNPASNPTRKFDAPNQNETQSSSIESATLDSLARGAGYSCSQGVLNSANPTICDVATTAKVIDVPVSTYWGYLCNQGYLLTLNPSGQAGGASIQGEEVSSNTQNQMEQASDSNTNQAFGTQKDFVNNNEIESGVAGAAPAREGTLMYCVKTSSATISYSCAQGILDGTHCNIPASTTINYSCSQGTLSGALCLIAASSYVDNHCTGVYTAYYGYWCTVTTSSQLWVASTTHQVYHPAVTSTVTTPGYYTSQTVPGYTTQVWVRASTSQRCRWYNPIHDYLCTNETVPGYWRDQYVPPSSIQVWHEPVTTTITISAAYYEEVSDNNGSF